ncbi:DegT/DnrJ/EryC1/StrS family aminotransferase [Evansella clarkii]|uniref:DegT/DnrJ/EryC1/StrS family aminotransferase n=1 Tax=Evansella clarkii TaxID=79879 RepID=UPI000997C92A|nr:DegT/DnrJ/EryC1/StrS family aminotransferase [Evansella clarkii]
MKDTFEEPIYINQPLMPDLDKVTNQMEKIWESKWLTNNGNVHKALEEELKKYLNIPNLSLFNNGTLALLLGLKSLDLKGEVITTPFTFPATVQALDWNGLTPVFCDIDAKTYNIDTNKIEELITEKTCAILAVHVFGNHCEVDTIEKIAKKYNLRVIYDGAHAFGSYIGDKPIGQYGDITMFSFHATKLFNTIEGGALVYNNKLLNRKLSLLKNFGLNGNEEVVLSGLNAKLNEIQAGVGIEGLKLVEEERSKRHVIKKVYEEELDKIRGIRIVTNLSGIECSYQYFVIEIDQDEFGLSRDFIHEELKKYNIFTRKYFSHLCSEFKWYSEIESSKSDNLPTAHKIAKQVLAMPYYGQLSLNSVKKICKLIQKIQRENRS